MGTILKGQCNNFKNCSKADAQVVQSVVQGNEFKCDQCERALTPILTKSTNSTKPILLAAVLLMLFTVSSFKLYQYWFPQSSIQSVVPNPSPNPKPSGEETTVIELNQLLKQIGNSNLNAEERDRLAKRALSQFFTKEAKIKEYIGNIFMEKKSAAEYLDYLSTYETLEDITIIKAVKDQSTPDKFSEISVKEAHLNAK